MDQRHTSTLSLSAVWAFLAYALSLLRVLDLLKALPGLVPRLLPAPLVHINGRTFKLLHQLGEGGYALVYLAREVASPQRPLVENTDYAIKKLITPTPERLDLARREIQIHSSLLHPSILRLIDSDTVGIPAAPGLPGDPTLPASSSTAVGPDGFVAIDVGAVASGGGATSAAAAYLLFPAFPDGTLAQEVERLHRAKQRLSTGQVLDTFQQVCDALSYMHDAKGLAHRDVKPHNVLSARQRQPPPQQQQKQPGHATTSPPSTGTTETTYQVVLMDFGSAWSRHAPVPCTRGEALALQEEAEAHCTATYRPPELFDVPTGLPLDYAKCDVWAAGCTLYHLMYGASPFQAAADQAGGSVALAALNCSIPWPKGHEQRYPEPLHDLVRSCLVQEPGQRPTAAQLASQAQLLLSSSPSQAAGASA